MCGKGGWGVKSCVSYSLRRLRRHLPHEGGLGAVRVSLSVGATLAVARLPNVARGRGQAPPLRVLPVSFGRTTEGVRPYGCGGL